MDGAAPVLRNRAEEVAEVGEESDWSSVWKTGALLLSYIRATEDVGTEGFEPPIT